MAILKVPVTPEDHIQGNEIASVTLLEYGDFQCPYCGRAYGIIKKIQEHFGNKLRFVFRNFPLSQIHPLALPAAETAEFAAANNLFWPMHDLIYEDQQNISIPMLLEQAIALKLPGASVEEAITTQKYGSKIKNDFLGGVKSGVNGTPTFFINENRHNGSFEFDVLASAIEAAL